MGGKCGKGNAKKERRYMDESSDSDSLSSKSSKSRSASSKSSKKSSRRKSPRDKGASSRGGTSGSRKTTSPTSPTKNKSPNPGRTTPPQAKKLVKRANPTGVTPPVGQFINHAVRPSTPSRSKVEAPRPPAPSASQFQRGQSTTSKYYIPVKDLNSTQAMILVPKPQQPQGKESTSTVTPSQFAHSPPTGGNHLFIHQYYQQQQQVNLEGGGAPAGLIPPPPNFEQMQQYEHMMMMNQGGTPFQPAPPVETMQQRFKMEQTITNGSSTPAPPPVSTRDGQQQLHYTSPPPFPTPPLAPPRQTQESNQQTRIVMLQLPQPEVPPSQQPPPPLYLPLPKPEDYYAQLNDQRLQNQILAHFEQQVKIRAAQPPKPTPPPSLPPQEGGPTYTTTYNHKFQATAPQPSFPAATCFPSPNEWQHYYAYKAQQQQLMQQRPPQPPAPLQMHQFEMHHKQQMTGGVGAPAPTFVPYPYQMEPRIQYQDYQQNRQQGARNPTSPKPSSRSTSAGSSKVSPPPLKTTTMEQLDQLHREVQDLKKMIKEQDTKELMIKMDQFVGLFKQTTKQYTELMYNAKLRSQIGRSDSMIGQQMSKLKSNYDDISSNISLLSNEVKHYKTVMKRSPGNTSHRDKLHKNSMINPEVLNKKMKDMMRLIKTLKESYSPEIMDTILAKDTNDRDRDEPGSDAAAGGGSNGFNGSSPSHGSSNDSTSSNKP